MKQPFVCPKCDGEKPSIKNCAVCNGSGVVWSSDNDGPIEVRRKVIIEEIEVVKRYRYPYPDYYPYITYYPPYRSPTWTTSTGDVSSGAVNGINTDATFKSLDLLISE